MTTFTREDYEMAAKAAGLRIKWIGDVAHDCTKLKPDAPAFKGPMWNPPEDDGDALRLAVKLGLAPCLCFQIVIDGEIARTGVRHTDRGGQYDELESHGSCPYAATRRAIFRAAIAIGRAMP